MFDCDNSVLVDTMSERKMITEKHTDIYIITPGGVGTMDEFFQVLTLRHLKQIDTPIVILNINGFYDSLLKLMDSLIELKVVSKDRTVIVIAHRLSTIFDADKIIVLDHGLKVEEGKHTDLVKKNGVYANIYRAQTANINSK